MLFPHPYSTIFYRSNQFCNRKLNTFLALTLYEDEISKLLPQVKLDTIVVNLSSDDECTEKNLKFSFVEIKECLINKNFSREDCYKIVKKLKTIWI